MNKYIGILFAIFLTHIPSLYAYNRAEVSTYANKYWGDIRSPIPDDNGKIKEGYNILGSPNYNQNDYYDYFPANDCANFVSQCVIAGGVGLGAGPGATGRRWLAGTTTYATIPYVDNLHSSLVNRREWGHKKLTHPDLSIPDAIKAGDVIIYGDYVHAAIVVEGAGGSSKVNSHTTDRYHRSWNYKYGTGAGQDSTCHLYHFDEEPAEVVLKDENSNIISDGGVTSSDPVYVYVSDTEIGSGVDKIEVRKNSDTGEIVFADDADHEFEDCVEGSTKYNARYSLADLADGQYFVKVFDQAGNMRSVGFPIADPRFLVEREKLMFAKFSQEIC
jgi:hypothetical protein